MALIEAELGVLPDARGLAASIPSPLNQAGVKQGTCMPEVIEALTGMIECLPDGVLIVRSASEMIYNQQFVEIWDLPADVLSAHSSWRILRRILAKLRTPAAILASLGRLAAEPTGRANETLSLKDGRFIECHSVPSIIRGEFCGRSWTFRDVTTAARETAFLREDLRLFDVLMENLPEHIYFKDRESRFTRVNRAMAGLFGVNSPADLVGRSDFDFFAPEHAGQAYSDEQQLIQEQTAVCSKEEKETWPDGRETWVLTTKMPLRDDQGEIAGTFGISRDITESRRVESRLRSTEDRLRLAQSALAIGSWELDLRTGKSKCSEQLLQIYGFPVDREGLTFEEWRNRLHADDRDRMTKHIESFSEKGGVTDQQYRVVWPDGTVRWLNSKALLISDPNGTPIRIIGVDFDITDLKAAERANAELAAVVMAAEAGIISLDLAGTVLTWNSGAERIYGYTAQEMIGRDVATLAPEDRATETNDFVAKLKAGESIRHYETVRITKSGKRISVLVSISPIKDRSGSTIGAAAIVTDITETKVLQGQLAQAQKLESIGQLAAGIAHEINTPIQYIGDNARFVQEACGEFFRLVESHRALAKLVVGSALADSAASIIGEVQDIDVDYLRAEIPQALDQLLQGVSNVARIVRAMKEFSHPGPVEKVPMDLNRAIESTVLVSRNEWKYVADLKTDLDEALPAVPCVAGEVNQVILNLIINAAHAIGDVVMNTGTKGVITVSTRSAGEWAEIRVCDTGTGIPEEIQSRIFDPFFTTKDVGKGTGQGLALAHAAIVQKHRGHIHFETRVGEGTTFVVQLPLRDTAKETGR